MSGLFYLCTPHSDPSEQVREARFQAACLYAGELMKLGLTVFSPISHSHPIAKRVDLPKTWEFWKDQDIVMLRLCSAAIVVCMIGWDKSIGVSEEIKLAHELRKPVYYIYPGHSIQMQVEGIKAAEKLKGVL